MQKPQGFRNDIGISVGSEGGKQSSTSRTACTRKKTKSFHPPIETYWHPVPLKVSRKPQVRLTAMLSQSFKYMGSFINLKKSQSTKVILEGSHDPSDEKIVDSFRELLFIEGPLPTKHYDYHTLLRFLRMRDFDLVKAKDMFMNYIKWREEFGIDRIMKDFKFEEYQEVKRCYPRGFHGVDRVGRPVYIERIGMVDLNRFLQVTTIERFVKHHICEQEKTLKWRFPACSLAAKKHIASTLSILDVKNVGMSQFSKPARYLFMEIQKIDSCYYPETLHQLFIINAGPGFKVLWKAIKAFLDTRTLAKIRVLGSDYTSSLIEAIDPSNLPTFLGGECMCSESGGCLFSDKGPWNNPEITETLQAMLYNEDEQEGQLTGLDEKCSLSSDSENARYNDAYDTTPPTGDTPERKHVDKHLLTKIQAFEPVLEATKEKIRMLEMALEDTKSVLRGLGEHIQELKR